MLDTDHLSLLMGKGTSLSIHLQNRLDASDDREIVTTVIINEEQTRGWLALASRARAVSQLIEYYGRLNRHLEGFRAGCAGLRPTRLGRLLDVENARIRVETMDLQIAAISLSRDATLLSRNLGDFRKVPNLKVEDWSLNAGPPTRLPRPT